MSSGKAAAGNSPVVTAAILAGLAAVWTAMLVLGTGPLDRQLLLDVYAGDRPWLALVAIGFTYLGTWPSVVVVTVLGAGWLFYQRRNWQAVTLLVASFSARVLVILQKAYFARLRPEEHLRMVEVHYQSFPSGHSANSMIAFLMLALLLFDDSRRTRIAAAIAVTLSVLIGISRPVLGVHWPSDVVAGWAFGLFWVLLLLAVSSRIIARRPQWALDRSH